MIARRTDAWHATVPGDRQRVAAAAMLAQTAGSKHRQDRTEPIDSWETPRGLYCDAQGIPAMGPELRACLPRPIITGSGPCPRTGWAVSVSSRPVRAGGICRIRVQSREVQISLLDQGLQILIPGLYRVRPAYCPIPLRFCPCLQHLAVPRTADTRLFGSNPTAPAARCRGVGESHPHHVCSTAP